MEEDCKFATEDFVNTRCEQSLTAYRRRSQEYRQRLIRLRQLGEQMELFLRDGQLVRGGAVIAHLREYMDLANSLAFEECAICYRQGYQDARSRCQTGRKK